MDILLLSRCRSFERHIEKVFQDRHSLHVVDTLSAVAVDPKRLPQLALIHAPSFEAELETLLPDLLARFEYRVTITSDTPTVEEMLRLSRWGIRGYCNSYMADIHYRQLAEMLADGQSWFLPHILQEVIQIASQSISSPTVNAELDRLTNREGEVVQLIAKGMSNRQIADICSISERTVKAHLTHIYKKLQVKDRFSLALYVNNHLPNFA